MDPGHTHSAMHLFSRPNLALPTFSRFQEVRALARRAGLLLAALTALSSLRAQSNYATPYAFTTLAGAPGNPGSTDATGSAARFNFPYGVAVDAAGNTYVADTNNSTVRKISSAGVVTTFAGTAGSSGSVDGTGSAARFFSPYGIAVDGSGNVYVADTKNYTIRKISPAGVVSTLAGTAGSAGSTDGTGSAARFFSPYGVAVDPSGNVYVADTYNNTIRKISSTGVVTTLAGSAGSTGSVDGTGSAARFYYPQGVAVDGAGNVYAADTYNGTIRVITSAGAVTTLAGTAGSIGSTNGTGSAARFNYPAGIVVDGAGNIYVADTSNYTIRKITAGAVVTTFAGTANNSGSADGTGGVARFYSPYGVAVDGAGNVYVADTNNSMIRKITPAAAVTTLAGSVAYGSADGTGSAALFHSPSGAAVDGAGNVYVADTNNFTIRKITSAGVATTLAGSAGTPGSTDGTGGAARFNYPHGVAVDAAGNVYVADTNNFTIRKITSAGVVTTLAGSAGILGSTDGVGSAARFYGPQGVAVDGSGNVFVADTSNHTIRKVTAAGVVTTLAGIAGTPGSSDGSGSAAQFKFPFGIAVDGAGNLYVADTYNGTIRKLTAAGLVTTLAGSAGSFGSNDGSGNAAKFNYPGGIAVDGAGTVFVADTSNFTVRKIATDGGVTTLAGDAGSAGSADGPGSTARFNYPGGVAVDGAGHVFIADTLNHSIRRGASTVFGDFNADGKPDILWQNSTSGDRGFWLMNGTSFASWVDIGIIATDWRVAATADFDGDGKPDILWENTATGDRGFWLMNGTSFASWVDIGIVSTDWRIAAAGDFNGDGKTDILWENTVTGDRGFWLMNGTTFASWVDIGIIAPSLRIAAVADFNGDGKTDILWENTVTGKRVIWFMNGTTFVSSLSLGNISTDWHIAVAGDFNGDGQADILWENTVTGDRGFWLMNGSAFASWVDIGIVSTDWHIAP